MFRSKILTPEKQAILVTYKEPYESGEISQKELGEIVGVHNTSLMSKFITSLEWTVHTYIDGKNRGYHTPKPVYVTVDGVTTKKESILDFAREINGHEGTLQAYMSMKRQYTHPITKITYTMSYAEPRRQRSKQNYSHEMQVLHAEHKDAKERRERIANYLESETIY